MAQKWAKYKHAEIKLLMGENPYYGPLQLELAKKFMTREDNYPNSLTDAYNMILHWNSTERGKGRYHAVKTESHTILIHNEDYEE